MPKYYVNTKAQPTREHEVHKEGCRWFPTKNAKYLGSFASCHGAIKEARKSYSKVDGCYYCSPECHNK